MLGALAGRNCVLLLFTAAASDGRNAAAATAPPIQAATTNQRYRMDTRPSTANSELINPALRGDGHLRGGLT